MGKRVVVESHDHHHHQHNSNNHTHHVTPVTTGARNIRKRKCNSNGNTTAAPGQHSSADKTASGKSQRLSSSSQHDWHENDDEDSSSNDGPPGEPQAPRNLSSKQANNSSILLNNSLNISLANEPNASLTESPKPVYTLRPSVVNGTVLYDLSEKPWRLGRPIGKGNFGEIFLASDNIRIPVTNENAKFVVKIEPHSNGPLFVEIHCLMNTAKKEKYEIKTEHKVEQTAEAGAATSPILNEAPSGIPDYIASGSHYFGNARYRFLVLPRFDRDLHSLIKKCRVHQKSVLTLAIHIINVLEHLHDKGYCHNDVKAQNLMISKCKYLAQSKVLTATAKESIKCNDNSSGGKQHIKSSSKYDDHYEDKQQTTDSGNSSEQEANDDDDEDFVVKRKVYNRVIDDDYDVDEDDNEEDEEEEEGEEEEDDDEDFDDGATTNSTNSNSMDNYRTPVNKNKRLQKKKPSRNIVEYSGSNPVRSCRRERSSNPIYDEMVSSHYLRPTKRVSYLEFFNEDNGGNGNTAGEVSGISSDDESEEFVPPSVQRSSKISSAKKTIGSSSSSIMSSRRLTRRQEKLLGMKKNPDSSNKRGKSSQEKYDDKKKLLKMEASEQQQQQKPRIVVEEERIFLIDFGLASKFIDNGIHRPFVMDQRRAHDGTLEFTSRDAHMGAHSRRSDMECLGYNLLFWSQGYLPWKEAATNQQQEKVHRAKEYLMTDVRELLRQIYGKQVPKYLGEYLHLVGQLNYHERPDYNRYRRLFEREYQQLGYSLGDMRLEMRDIQRTCVRVKEEIENKNDFFDMNKTNGVFNVAYNVMQTAAGGTPFHERTISNRVSPKNLRSKSDKKETKKKKFSWTEILSQDPDLIARERAEKEFDREEELSDIQQSIVRRYQGKATYAIRHVLDRMGRLVEDYEQERDEQQKTEQKNKAKQLKEENDVEMDDCDGGGDYFEPMDVDEDNESEEAETDATEISEQLQTVNSRRQKTLPKSRGGGNASSKAKKTVVARKLILKTPNNMTSAENSEGTSGTPAIKKTTRKKSLKVKLAPSPTYSTPVSTIESSTAVKHVSKSAKSTKRGSAISRSSRKTSASAAASAAGEVEQQQQSSTANRERRTRRRLLKTEQAATEGLVEDDSNSNFSPDGHLWKDNNHTEVVYSRNCKK